MKVIQLIRYFTKVCNQKPEKKKKSPCISITKLIRYLTKLIRYFTKFRRHEFPNSTMPAADQIQTSQRQYDVFLSSSDDLENGFAGHFKAALNRAKICVYTQENETVHHVEELGSDRKKGIEKSMFLIVVLSKGYASSARCLNELAHILECRKKASGHVVIPVFYDVDPSDVAEQKGSFENAFVEHEKRFGEELGRVESWRAALREVCLLRGLDLPRSIDGAKGMHRLTHT